MSVFYPFIFIFPGTLGAASTPVVANNSKFIKAEVAHHGNLV
jgi:hypothetical protein